MGTRREALRECRTEYRGRDGGWWGPRWRWEEWERRLRLIGFFYALPWRCEVRAFDLSLSFPTALFIVGAARVDNGGDDWGLYVGVGICLRFRCQDTDYWTGKP